VCGLAARVGYGLPNLAQQDGESAVVLTEGSNWPGKQRRVADGEVRAAGRRGAHEGVRCRVSLASNHHGSTRGVPVGMPREL
jgi:hypothetical protein